MTTPTVTIVIPVFNAAKTVVACVRSVLERTRYPDWSVIVVDDGSTDGSAELLGVFTGVQIIRKQRGGVASALNVGFAAAAPRDVVRLHADVVIDTDDWLALLVEAAGAQPKAGIVGVRLVYPDGRIQSEGRHFISGLGMHPQHCTLRAFLPDGAPGGVQEVDATSGALAYYRREVLDAVGGLDENYGPVWLEDDDFCIAARRAGFKVYLHGGVKAVHFTRGLSPGFRALIPESEHDLRLISGQAKEACNRALADYWEAKWGWNPFFPDLGEIRRLYGDTQICWRIGEPLRYRLVDPTPTVDCCLVTCNTLPLLRRCLDSLARTDYPADRINVYIADNASSDGTPAYLAELAKNFPFTLHPLRLAVNTGCPVGLNFAVAAGLGDLVARLDDDIVLPPGWLRLMVGDLQRRPFAGCVGPKIINDDERQTIQCGPYRHYPNLHGHDDEEDTGQADYLSRTSHVRGCCNLYRREVFARSGPFDSRFSPTQGDDPDHHLAVLQAGYEIIYDGRVRVLHKLNNGLGRSWAALSNQKANQVKLLGKWGEDVWEIVERSIDFSREGRYLPDDGDTTAWLAQGPAAPDFPRDVEPSLAAGGTAIFCHYDALAQAGTRGDVAAWTEEYLAFADHAAHGNVHRVGIDHLHVAVNFSPAHPGLLAALAGLYSALGQRQVAAAIVRRAQLLFPEDERLQAVTPPAAGEAALPLMLQRVNQIGEEAVTVGTETGMTEVGGLRVLMVNTFEQRLSGGDMQQIKKTRQYLQRLGVHVDLCCTPRPDPRGYDLVHVWNTWFPAQTLAQVKAVRAWRPEMPIVLTPIFWDMKEKCWADTTIPSIFSQSASPAQLEERLKLLANGKLLVNGRTRLAPAEPNYRGYLEYQRALFGLVDHLLPLSKAEMANLGKIHGLAPPFTLVHNGAETAVFDQATPDWFVENYRIKDFILSVGLVEPRKNQLLLLHALRDSGWPIVIVGRHYDRNYYKLCRQHAPKGTIFIDHLPHEHLASAFKAARVHALPSWMECAALVNIEAALGGCALAVSDRTSEQEYFGVNAYYCDPASVASIRQAVAAAWHNHAKDAPKRNRLIEQFRRDFTWEHAAVSTLRAYQTTLAGRNPSAKPAVPEFPYQRAG